MNNNNNATPLMNPPLPMNNNNGNPKKKYKYKYTINQNIPGLIEENVTKTPNSLPFQFYIIQNIKAHTQSVTCLIELQNQSMASCSLDKTIKLWGKANSGEFILYRTYEGHTEGVMAIREMPEFKALCSCSIDKCIKIWELKNTTCIATLKGHTMPVIAIDYSSSLKFIFSGSDDLTVRIWNATDHKTVKVIKDNQQSVTAVLYVDPFAYLVTGSDDKMLKFYNGKNNFEWVKTIDTLLSEIVCLKYAGSRVLASCQDGNVFFINIKFLKRIRSVKFSNDAVHDFFVMDHDTFLVTGGTDCKGRVWKVGSGERTVLSGHSREINGIILLSDGRIASASADKTILVWVADQKNEDEGNGGGGGDEDEYEEG
jgi:WD40 repeat protein